MFLIGFTSLLYSVFGSVFAKNYVRLPGLNLPIFVGEIVLGICFLFYLFQRMAERKWEKWDFAWITYLIFVLVKGIYGYAHYGPLALRHAAMFHYPLFAVFVAYFYDKRIFSFRVFSIPFSVIILLLLTLTMTILPFLKEFVVTFILLALIIIIAYPAPSTRILMIIMLALVPAFKLIFYTSRAFLVANLAAGIFLIVAFCLWVPVKRQYKFIFTVFVSVLYIAFGFHQADESSIQSLTKISPLIPQYKEIKEYITQREKTFVMRPLAKVNLYNSPEIEHIQVSQANADPCSPNCGQEYLSPSQVIENVAQAPSGSGEIKTAENVVSSDAASIPVLTEVSEKKDDKDLALLVTVGELKEEKKKNPLPSAPAPEVDQPRHAAVTVSLAWPSPLINPESEKKMVAGSQSPKKERCCKPLKSLDAEKPLLNEWNANMKTFPIDFAQEYNLKRNPLPRSAVSTSYTNILFRLFIWQDLIDDIIQKDRSLVRFISGFSFGLPFRSQNLEILEWAKGEWERDGWICSHNSYLEIIYRTGILGIILICFLWRMTGNLTRVASLNRSLIGILLCGILVNWLTGAVFGVVFELPYYAIPIWSLFGLAYAYIMNEAKVA